jgi:hypothetical protein
MPPVTRVCMPEALVYTFSTNGPVGTSPARQARRSPPVGYAQRRPTRAVDLAPCVSLGSPTPVACRSASSKGNRMPVPTH